MTWEKDNEFMDSSSEIFFDVPQNNWKKNIIVCISCLVLSFLLVIFFSGICLAFEPFQWSTQISRAVSSNSCNTQKICNEYLLLGNDPTTSMIVVFHSKNFLGDPIAYYGLSLGSKDYEIQGTMKKLNNVYIDRYIYSFNLYNLEPGSTYYVSYGDKGVNGMKIRTFPKNGNITFAVGGDMGTTETAVSLLESVAKQEPDFMFIGGDIAYSNSMCTCWDRWDKWFENWNRIMKSDDGYIIPLTVSIGNHDAGGYNRNKSEVKYYFDYFPISKESYHIHYFNLFKFLILDTHHVSHSSGIQQEWLVEKLSDSKYQEMPTIVGYHVPMYPASISEFGTERNEEIRTNWVPIFDEYNIGNETFRFADPIKLPLILYSY
eukprot:TRINITY_DN3015_c0_g1_i2.p1 TRINITY_DN3015_c0_g1~~TRINITY_DN3015_c0_g1_i2.p1  ORF type:complete len:375 (-),score=67.15 TRINITY_DN3015_c0_g1_i2:351-1475(-)